MKTLIAAMLTAFAASGLLATAQQADNKNQIIHSSFDVLPSMSERFADISASLLPEDLQSVVAAGQLAEISRHDNYWKRLLSDFGVTWPAGSAVKHIPATGKLMVANTRENMMKIEQALAELNVLPTQVEIEVHFVQFDLTDIEELAKQGIINTSSLKELWDKGKGRLLFAPKVVTEAGEEATVKGVTEYIYPTEFKVTPIMSSTTSAYPVVLGAVAEPGSFETREVGIIMSVLPDVSIERNLICLIMTPEVVDEPAWKDYGARYKDSSDSEQHLPMEQPFFHTHMVSTSVSMKNGATVMLGGGMAGRDPSKVVYAFVTARLVDIEGNPILKED
jgi:type II secretory pathway component GspD/PulD (secretin)